LFFKNWHQKKQNFLQKFSYPKTQNFENFDVYGICHFYNSSSQAQSDLDRLRSDVKKRLTEARNKLNQKLTNHFPELNTNSSVIEFFTDSTVYLGSAENDHDPVLFGRYAISYFFSYRICTICYSWKIAQEITWPRERLRINRVTWFFVRICIFSRITNSTYAVKSTWSYWNFVGKTFFLKQKILQEKNFVKVFRLKFFWILWCSYFIYIFNCNYNI